jgi:hypothetical protein
VNSGRAAVAERASIKYFADQAASLNDLLFRPDLSRNERTLLEKLYDEMEQMRFYSMCHVNHLPRPACIMSPHSLEAKGDVFVRNWLKQNCKGQTYRTFAVEEIDVRRNIYFEFDTDAIFFKLTWD